MENYYLIGERLAHSWSAEIHRAFGRYDYELLELSPAELGSFLKARDFAGLNVTIPYKEAVIPYLDRLDPAAAAIGAVNTVVNRDGTLWGYNTDFGGMAAALVRDGIDLKGKTVLILGTGGSSKTALAVCRSLGAAQIFRVSRTDKDGALSYTEAYARFGRLLPRDSGSDAPHPSAPAALPPSPEGEGFGPADTQRPVLINCTPVGMWPNNDETPLSLTRCQGPSCVFDCVYNPLRTRLVLEAQARGIPAAGGLYMLVKQAALACGLFTGIPAEDEQVDIIYNSLRREQENIVLIGMPGAGKTTIGRILAQKCGKKFVDIDEELVARTGKPVSAIFAASGEECFRDLESAAVREAAALSGAVIATGGGTVLRAENVRRLKQNGRLVFLDRPLAALVPSPDRPLGDTAEKVARLSAERAPLYAAAADLTVPVAGSPEETAEAVLAAL